MSPMSYSGERNEGFIPGSLKVRGINEEVSRTELKSDGSDLFRAIRSETDPHDVKIVLTPAAINQMKNYGLPDEERLITVPQLKDWLVAQKIVLPENGQMCIDALNMTREYFKRGPAQLGNVFVLKDDKEVDFYVKESIQLPLACFGIPEQQSAIPFVSQRDFEYFEPTVVEGGVLVGTGLTLAVFALLARHRLLHSRPTSGTIEVPLTTLSPGRTAESRARYTEAVERAKDLRRLQALYPDAASRAKAGLNDNYDSIFGPRDTEHQWELLLAKEKQEKKAAEVRRSLTVPVVTPGKLSGVVKRFLGKDY